MIEINLGKKILINDDCMNALKQMPDNSIDSIVTDPPYGLNFMGKKWDYDVPKSEIFKEMLRVLKPGGHMLCACGTRTQHRMAVNIEDAGFEIRDVITWLYGSGFPKSRAIDKDIDKMFGAEREIVGERGYSSPDTRGDHSSGTGGWNSSQCGTKERINIPITAPATDSAKEWQGWGTALKPACEFWTLARKPLSEKTVAANVLKHSTGGINIDGCRVGDFNDGAARSNTPGSGRMKTGGGLRGTDTFSRSSPSKPLNENQGRWPANLILDEEAAEVLDQQTGELGSGGSKRNSTMSELHKWKGTDNDRIKDKGGASRFFYVAKASRSERNQGCESLEARETKRYGDFQGTEDHAPKLDVKNTNFHPTVKPIKLMTYLCRLITPPNGIVLDPFMGSGSTGVAAIKEGLGFIGIERELAYFEICKARIESA